MMRATVIFLLFIALGSKAQHSSLVFEHYGMQQGFTSRSCRTVAKTPDGMVWLTTDDGLVRYDSKKFRYYRYNPADSNSISSNLTDQMVADNKGRLWIVAGAGLDVFDPGTEKFSHCYFIQNGIKKTDFSPESLFYDKELDLIWVGTHFGLYYCESGSRLIKKARADIASADLLDLVFIDIKKDKNGLLWLCNEFGFFSYAAGSGRLTPYHVPDQLEHIANDDDAFCVFPDDSIIWVGTWTKGLVKYDLRSGKGKHYYAEKNKTQNGINYITKSGKKEEQKLLWLSTPTSGLATFDTRTEKFSFYKTDNENDKNGIKGKTNRMLPTATEGMWIASENGLHRYDYSQQLFSFIDLEPFNSGFANAEAVEFINIQPAADGSDSLYWFHIPYYGPFCYNSRSQQLLTFPEDFRKYFNTSVFSFYMDRDKRLWAGTDKFGLVGFDTKSRQVIQFDKIYFSGTWEWVTEMMEDSKKRLWLGTYKGLYMLDANRKTIIEIKKLNAELANSNSGLTVNSLAEDGRGRIWFTVSGNTEQNDAFGHYDPQRNLVQTWIANSGEELLKGMKFNDIESSREKVALATNRGLLLFNGNEKQPAFKLLDVNNGLINNFISNIIADKRGNIWCSNVFGISCYLTEKNFFINYSYTSSGIGALKHPSLTISPGSGNLYISQQGGINVVNPDEIMLQPLPRILFTGMQVFSKPFFNKKHQLLSGDVIRLKHYQNMVSFEFSGMCFSNANDNQYAYRLEGLEKDWNVSKENVASYTNLSPGRYTLLVKASNSSGTWTTQPSTLTVIITPPFWKTWWFIALVVLSIMVLLYALYRYRINQLLRIQRIRNTISRNLHDEIGSTLTSISILSAVSQQAVEKDPLQAKEMLEKIAGQSKAIQQNMSDIVWAIRSDNDKVDNLLVRIREYAAQTLEPLGIKTVIEAQEELLNKTLSLEARKEILLIFKESLNNIARHSGAKEVLMCLERNAGRLKFSISDNGQWKKGGIGSGTGLLSMQQRAVAIGGNFEVNHNNDGTSVILTIPLT